MIASPALERTGLVSSFKAARGRMWAHMAHPTQAARFTSRLAMAPTRSLPRPELVSAGVPLRQILVADYGETPPADACPTGGGGEPARPRASR